MAVGGGEAADSEEGDDVEGDAGLFEGSGGVEEFVVGPGSSEGGAELGGSGFEAEMDSGEAAFAESAPFVDGGEG